MQDGTDREMQEDMARQMTREEEDVTRKRTRDAEDTARKAERNDEDMDRIWSRRVGLDDEELRHESVVICPELVAMLYGSRRPAGGELEQINNGEFCWLNCVNPNRCTVALAQLHVLVAKAYELREKHPEKWSGGHMLVLDVGLDIVVDGRAEQIRVFMRDPGARCCDAHILVEAAEK